MAKYMEQRKAYISAGFEAGLRCGRQQILDLVSLVLRDPKYVGKDIFSGKRLMKVVTGVGDYIDMYNLAWQKDDETDYYRAKLDDALAEAYGEKLHDSFMERYEVAPEYDYTKGKWK